MGSSLTSSSNMSTRFTDLVILILLHSKILMKIFHLHTHKKIDEINYRRAEMTKSKEKGSKNRNKSLRNSKRLLRSAKFNKTISNKMPHNSNKSSKNKNLNRYTKLSEGLFKRKPSGQKKIEDDRECEIPDEFYTDDTGDEATYLYTNNSTTREKSRERSQRRTKNVSNKNQKANKKSRTRKPPKSFLSPKEAVMIKTIPLFFSEEKEEEINLGESVYTQISKDILIKDNLQVSKIYEEMTNRTNIKKAAERRSGRKKNPEVIKRLLSPPKKDIIIADDIFNATKAKAKNDSFMTYQEKTCRLKIQYSSSQLDSTDHDRKCSQERLRNCKIIATDSDQKGNYTDKFHFNESVETVKSKRGDNYLLNNPSIFTEHPPTSSNFSQRASKKTKERSKSTKKRFNGFYEQQMKYVDIKNTKIQKKIHKRERLVEDLRRQKERFSLLSSGSRKILNRSSKRSTSKENLFKNMTQSIGTTSILDNSQKHSVDFRSPVLHKCSSTASVHDRLFNDSHTRQESRRNLLEKYQEYERNNSKSNSRSRKSRDAGKDLLRINRSAHNLKDGTKNMQQSSQANLSDIASFIPVNHNLSNQIAKEVSTKLYNDACRRMERTSSRSRSRNRSQNKNSSQSRNPASNKYLKDIFETDFQKAIIDRAVKTRKLNYYHTNEILKSLGFMFTDEDHNDKADERMLFLDFWRCLRGDENDGIAPKDLKMLLSCIEGILVDKKATQKNFRKGMKPLDYIMRKNSKEIRNLKKPKETQPSQKAAITDLMSFDDKCNLKIIPKDYAKIRKYFITFATNRSNFLNKKISEKISQRKKPVDYSHKPKINKKSRKIVKTLHSKLSKLKIPHYELLLYKGKEYEKRKEMNISEKNTKLKKDLMHNLVHKRKNSTPMSSSGSKVEEYDSIVVTKKPNAFQEYLDPNTYESQTSTPTKSHLESTESCDKSGNHGTILSNGQLDKSELFNTSPIIEEEYSCTEETPSSNMLEADQEKSPQSQESDCSSLEKEQVHLEESPPDFDKGYPILYVDINLGKERVERLTVYEGEDPSVVSAVFAEKTGINEKMRIKLENMLKDQLSSILSRINEEDEEDA
ncbi:unnamed protein product [Moneuplotes crassus]|uniref:Uncharacterized protein n=1 Tax=Euplotes crassus TaxID=5936 RepID=A0AAD1XMX8_EUPCR|nr:unnamed protein product [Moneuplotes crassus]